jgi:hypothetical protein
MPDNADYVNPRVEEDEPRGQKPDGSIEVDGIVVRVDA